MLKKRGRRRLWAVLGTMLLAAALGVCALAASDVPKAVLNARESVVRIMTEGAMGSGFALSENSVYVVTNHHVIEGAETIEVIVDDTRWTTARVYVDLPGKDICILKTDKPLRGMPGLPLRSDAVETGLAVYALGYPGAADDFSREFATGVDSITVTDGIVSAVRQSRAEGLQTTWAIQTNAPISPGNSGGPLVDAGGRLVGINTFIMLEGQNVNGSIHVRELLTVLQQNDIPYRKAAPSFAGVLLVVLAVAAALGVCAALLLRLRRRGAASGKPMREKAVPLPVFLAGGGRMDRLRATRAVRELAQRLASIPEDSRALHPENILVRSGTLELKRAHGAGKRPGASVCAGYSAPECYNGSAGMAAAVYFLGAVLYALTEGRAPQDVIARAGGAELVFEEQTPLVPLLNRAMALNEAYRIAAPAQLAQELAQVEAQLAAAQPAQTVPAQELPQAQRAALQEAAPLGPFAPQGSGGTPGAGYAPSAVCTPQAPRRKKRGWKIALAVGLPLVLLGGGFLGYSLYAWNEIETAQAYEQYTQAYEWYERAPWLWELDEQRGQYTAAWVLVERGELSEAAQAFRELGDYADSGELAEKCNTYIRAQTVGSPFTKYKLYNNLGGFLDSSRQAQAQIPEIYDTALEHYGENRFSAAMEWLEIIPDYENYEDAFVYVEACKAHTVLSENYYKMTREVQNALEMLEWSDQYIDVEPICMDRYLIDYFLDGTWVAVDGDVFEYAMENNEFDFWYRYVPSGKYNFESDGMYYASSGTRFAAWDYISYNEIVITFESDGRSYHYYRQ